MTLHLGDRAPDDGTLRCTACGHTIELLSGGAVPRCYCGNDAFEYVAHACDAHTPRPARDAARRDRSSADTIREPPA